MTPDLIFLIPTRGRPGALQTCLDAIAATTNVPSHILVGFDDDVTNFNQFRPRPYVTPILMTPRHYFVRGMNRLYREMRTRFPETSRFIVCNDDDRFVSWDWGPQVLKFYDERFPEGRGLLELFWAGRVHCYLSSVETFGDGPIYDPVYTQYWSDQELQERLASEGLYAAIEAPKPKNRIVEHNILSTLDPTSNETMDAWHDEDTRIYNERKKR